jgi:hypothetical protein
LTLAIRVLPLLPFTRTVAHPFSRAGRARILIASGAYPHAVGDEGESPADVSDGHGYDGCEDIAGLIIN